MSEGPSKAAIKRTRLGIAAAFVLFWVYSLALNFYASERMTILVEKVNAADYCRMPWGRFARLQHSAHPISVIECGDVITDQGQFRLPRTKLNWLDLQMGASVFDQPRGVLHGKLKQGCRYDVKIVGWGDDFKRFRKGQPRMSNRVRHRISRIYTELGCNP